MASENWHCSDGVRSAANVTRLINQLVDAGEIAVEGSDAFESLWRYSVESPEEFWPTMFSFLGLETDTSWTQVLQAEDPRFPKWFSGSTLNIAQCCVYRNARNEADGGGKYVGTHGKPNPLAIKWEGEDGTRRQLTWQELREAVDAAARGLINEGVLPGDRVALFMPMIPEVAVAFYAVAAVGAIAVPIFSGFAAEAVAQRLEHSKAKVMICVDATPRRGSSVEVLPTAQQAVKMAGCIEKLVVYRRGDVAAKKTSGDGVVEWRDLVNREAWSAAARDAKTPVMVDSEHPLMLAYTSGTTGAPKAAVHVHGGFMTKIAEEGAVQTDIKPSDTVSWVTDMGWIMGPWLLVGAHANGACVMMYEGAPDFPTPARMWEIVDNNEVTVQGVSPTLIRALMAHGDEHLSTSTRKSLRVLASTGEPWNHAPYTWLHQRVAEGRCPIINLSGGTEVGACFLSPTPLTEFKPMTLGSPCLGMAMEVRDESGEALGRGEGVGELVCTQPWPGMTRGFWGEGGKERYIEAYWSRWPNVWVHGDWASIDEDGLWYLHGRSDDTINVAGKRIGPAEYESILVSHDLVKEAAAIGVPHQLKGESVWCFVVCKAENTDQDTQTSDALKQYVAARLGKPFSPEKVLFVDELPRTRSAKIVRRAIRNAALGKEMGDTSMIENPASIQGIEATVRQS